MRFLLVNLIVTKPSIKELITSAHLQRKMEAIQSGIYSFPPHHIRHVFVEKSARPHKAPQHLTPLHFMIIKADTPRPAPSGRHPHGIDAHLKLNASLGANSKSTHPMKPRHTTLDQKAFLYDPAIKKSQEVQHPSTQIEKVQQARQQQKTTKQRINI